ncbi:DUF4148 domain-containing protein [Undibacterium sp.]|jgi:hypothetical protein|uniref:DUF4148 domain-containing protein n=1 Tax=Undibacterium sp. TaxID=1914977 RepID=UPI002BE25EBF|nr:DUF4148 domain-containing protein [Undibacterium sp.]HTD05018.1 DUF4148 domain-containing protein [Undibacterium sp.]
MNAKQLLVAVTLIAAGTSAAFAAETGKTRAEVQAELAQARADSAYIVGGSEYVAFANVPGASTKTRAEVQAELKQARDQGLLATRDAEYPAQPATQTARSRAEVRAEAIQAAQNKSTEYDIGG